MIVGLTLASCKSFRRNLQQKCAQQKGEPTGGPLPGTPVPLLFGGFFLNSAFGRGSLQSGDGESRFQNRRRVNNEFGRRLIHQRRHIHRFTITARSFYEFWFIFISRQEVFFSYQNVSDIYKNKARDHVWFVRVYRVFLFFVLVLSLSATRPGGGTSTISRVINVMNGRIEDGAGKGGGGGEIIAPGDWLEEIGGRKNENKNDDYDLVYTCGVILQNLSVKTV